MKWNHPSALELGPTEADLLIWSVTNEVINGFRIDDFKNQIGTTKEDFENISNRLQSFPSTAPVSVTVDETKALRNALSLTLDELGDDEFSTRTGHDFEMGSALLAELDHFLAESGA